MEEKCKCLVFSGDEKKDEESYVVHGVKVSSYCSEDEGETTKRRRYPLVLLHGYANGAMYYYRNLVGLRRFFGTVYSLDMLGWGLSSRPAFRTKENTVESAEDVFVESLEAWRAAHDIDRMVLGGHSFGGYVSVAYCERYPERVERLILISPVGVPHHEDELELPREAGLRWRTMLWTIKRAWKSGLTPGSVLRSLPESRGRAMIRRYLDGRIPAIRAEDEKVHLTEYLYDNSALPASAERALNRVLKPVAFARKPLAPRIPRLKVDKVAFVYGAQDWMDPSGGLDVQERCSSSTNAPDVEVYAVRNAGHLMMLENWEEFNSAVIMANGGKLPAKSPLAVKLMGGVSQN